MGVVHALSHAFNREYTDPAKAFLFRSSIVLRLDMIDHIHQGG
jgi:hypothetical protein